MTRTPQDGSKANGSVPKDPRSWVHWIVARLRPNPRRKLAVAVLSIVVALLAAGAWKVMCTFVEAGGLPRRTMIKELSTLEELAKTVDDSEVLHATELSSAAADLELTLETSVPVSVATMNDQLAGLARRFEAHGPNRPEVAEQLRYLQQLNYD